MSTPSIRKLKMTRNTTILFFLAVSLGIVASFPSSQPNYDNIPQCLQPPVSGLCMAYFPSYYYNPSKETCLDFIYGGCQGNANRFFSFDECMAKCAGFKAEKQDFKLILESDAHQAGSDETSVQRKPLVEGDESEDICRQTSKQGPCRAMMPRFYFDGDDCKTFIYGGCQGNENNFKTLEECQQRCPPKSSEENEAISNEQLKEHVKEQPKKSEENDKE